MGPFSIAMLAYRAYRSCKPPTKPGEHIPLGVIPNQQGHPSNSTAPSPTPGFPDPGVGVGGIALLPRRRPEDDAIGHDTK